MISRIARSNVEMCSIATRSAVVEGQRLGTVTGYVWVKSIKGVPGAKLCAYPNATASDDAQVKQHPEYEFFRPYMTSFYVPKQEPKLEAAVSAEIRKMYASGELSKLIAKWGVTRRSSSRPRPRWRPRGAASTVRRTGTRRRYDRAVRGSLVGLLVRPRLTISAAELMSQGQLIASETFRALEVYAVVSVIIYFVLCYPLSQALL